MKIARIAAALLACLPLAVPGPVAAQAKAGGKAVYEKTCALCHGPGLVGAPRLGQAAEWAPRIKAGTAKLYQSALKGTPNGMPGKGGDMRLTDDEVKAAVDYLVAASGGAPKAQVAAAVPARPVAPPAATPVAPPAATPAPPPVSRPTAPPAAAAAPASPPDPNAFNRLMGAPGTRNPPPAEDGIHDAANPGTLALQHPRASFNGLPPLNAGNRIDWGKSLEASRIQPRWDRNDAAVPAVVMDLNIVREVKGSMPDVVYSHKKHTEWLDCSACHPAIFIPQKGANQISMAAIMLGQKCGVCHGKVAFPVSECRLCHSKNKEATTRTAGPVAAEGKP